MSNTAAAREDAVESMRTARRTATRHWRLVTAVYVTALTVGTHWPKLDVSVGEGPPPDKVLHLFAFGGMALLLWQCRFTRRAWLVGLITALWVVFDEWTQSLPMLGRETTWEDVAAGLAGVACAVMWIWATAPVGGRIARWRRALFDQVVDDRLSRVMGWLWLSGGALSIALIAACLSYGWLVAIAVAAPIMVGDPFITALIAFCLGGVFGVHVVFDFWFVNHRNRIATRMCCYRCGQGCATVAYNSDGSSNCPDCGENLHYGQWNVTAMLSSDRIRQVRLGASGLALLLLFVTAAMLFVFYNGPSSINGSASYPALHSVFNLTVALLPLSIALRAGRQEVARMLDRQGVRCLRCDYELGGLKLQRGVGHCPECGTPFVRLDKANRAECRRA